MLGAMHAYEVRPRKDHRGANLISDALPFGRQKSGRSRAFRLLPVVAVALMLMAAFAPGARADLIAYFNFEDSTVGGPPDFTSDSPPAFLGETTVISTNINSDALTTVRPGLDLNRWPTDPDPNNLALGMSRSGENHPGNLDIPLPTSQGFFQDMSVSFAIDVVGNGYTLASLFYSTDGGVNFTNSGNSVTIPNLTREGPVLITLPVPTAANNVPDLVLRIQFTGGQSSGANLQDVSDNIRVEGTIVPEPTTIAGGLLGVLGLCWHQRRRLIRCVRLLKGHNSASFSHNE
jgi:hypothetical protein